MSNLVKITQELKVLEVLKNANGSWVNGQYFLRNLMLSQYHRAIWNLQNKRDRYEYIGIIEASDFVDEYGFKSYRLKTKQPTWESLRQQLEKQKIFTFLNK